MNNIDNYADRLKTVGVLYVDLYPFRKTSKGDFEYLLFRRNDKVELANTWQTISGKIEKDERISEAFSRLAKKRTGVNPKKIIKLQTVNMFYDEYYDTVMLVPTSACELAEDDEVVISDLHTEYRWSSKEEALDLLIWPNQKKVIELIEVTCKSMSSDFSKYSEI